MVGHQDVRVHGTASVKCTLAQHLQISQVIILQMEARDSVIASLDNM